MGNLEDLVASSTCSVTAGKHVLLELDGQLFAIAAQYVLDVSGSRNVTPIPLAPPEIRGLINFREQAVTVIDIRPKLGFGSAAVQNTNDIVIGYNNNLYAFVVDKIVEITSQIDSSVVMLDLDKVLPASSTY